MRFIYRATANKVIKTTITTVKATANKVNYTSVNIKIR